LSTGFSRLAPICPSNPAAPSARLGRDLGSVGFRQDGRCESVLPDPLASPVSLPARKTLPAGSQRSKSGVTLSRFPSSGPLTVHTRTHPPGMRQARGRRAPPQPRGRSHEHGDAGADHNDEEAGRTTRTRRHDQEGRGDGVGHRHERTEARPRGHVGTTVKAKARQQCHGRRRHGAGARDSPGRRPRSEGCGVLTLTFHDATSTRTWPRCAPATPGLRDNVIGCSDVAGLAPPPPGPAEVTRKRSRTTTRPGRRHEPSAKIRARWILYEDHRAGGKDLPTSASRCESWTSVSAGAANCTQDPSQRLRASKIRQGTRCSQGPRRPARVRDDQPGSATTSQGPRPRPLRRAAAFLWARVRGGSQDLRRTREP
jgi:hypothetical protein